MVRGSKREGVLKAMGEGQQSASRFKTTFGMDGEFLGKVVNNPVKSGE
jgi:hypothetical protein